MLRAVPTVEIAYPYPNLGPHKKIKLWLYPIIEVQAKAVPESAPAAERPVVGLIVSGPSGEDCPNKCYRRGGESEERGGQRTRGTRRA